MACVEGYSDFVLCYKTELKSVVRGHDVYQSVWTSTVGENLFTALDKREEALSYDEFAIGVYKEKSVVYWLSTYQSKFQACLIIFSRSHQKTK